MSKFISTPKHKHAIFSMYRQLLRLARAFNDDINKSFYKNQIDERFRFYKTNKNKKVIQLQIYRALQARDILQQATRIQNPKENKYFKLVEDFSTGKEGRMYYLTNKINDYDNHNKPCRLLYDIRPTKAIKREIRYDKSMSKLRIKDEKGNVLPRYMEKYHSLKLQRVSKYSIPFDRRIYNIPDRVAAITQESVYKRYLNRAKICKDNLKVQKVCTTSGYRFYRIKGRTMPHWLGIKIKRLTLYKDKLVKKRFLLEDYTKELEEENIFLRRLGIRDYYGDSIRLNKSAVSLINLRLKGHVVREV